MEENKLDIQICLKFQFTIADTVVKYSLHCPPVEIWTGSQMLIEKCLRPESSNLKLY